MGRFVMFARLSFVFLTLLLVGCSEIQSPGQVKLAFDTPEVSDSEVELDTNPNETEYQPKPFPDDTDVIGGGGLGPEEITVPGKTYYVDSETGNDANDGLSRDQAFKTLEVARFALSAQGGDKLVVKGTFKDTMRVFNINQAGDESRPTVVQCDFDEGGNPLPAIIDGGLREADFPFDRNGLEDGFGPGLGNYLRFGVAVDTVNYITISGITVRGIAGRGVWFNKVNHSVVEWTDIAYVSNSAIRVHNDTGNHWDPKNEDLTIRYNRINHTNLGFWANKPDGIWQYPDTTAETFNINGIDGFLIHNNHISNSFKAGIDFKMGSKNGVIRNNIIEATRNAAIYANEGVETDIYHNVIRHVGWYDAEDGTGLQLAGDYIDSVWDGNTLPVHGVGILIANGDLGEGELATRESGRTYGISVFENLITWTLKPAVATYNEWEFEGRDGWLMDDIEIYNNTTYKTNMGKLLGYPSNAAAIALDNTTTNSLVINNILTHSPQYGIHVIEYLNANMDEFWASNSFDNNIWHSNALNPKAGGDNLSFEDPLFAFESPAVGESGDFQLQTSSPAIGAAVPSDNNTYPDMGAYQSDKEPWFAGIN